MDYIQCIFSRNKKIIEAPPIEEDKNQDDNVAFDGIKECSWAGCMLEFYEHRQQMQHARIGKRIYAFCSEYCYSSWLSGGYFL